MKKNEMDGACSMCGRNKRCIQVFGGETEGKGPLGRSRHRWVDNIKMDLQEVVWGAWNELMWLRIGTGGRRL